MFAYCRRRWAVGELYAIHNARKWVREYWRRSIYKTPPL